MKISKCYNTSNLPWKCLELGDCISQNNNIMQGLKEMKICKCYNTSDLPWKCLELGGCISQITVYYKGLKKWKYPNVIILVIFLENA